MAKPILLSPLESAALAAARRALARGAFDEVAARYEQAARARDRAHADGTRHWRRALDFWVAAGEPNQGLACARRLLARRLKTRERGPVVLAVGQLHLLAGRPRQAGREFARAVRLLRQDRDRRRQALMGEAEARIALGDARGAHKLLVRCLGDAEKSGDAWAACSAELRLGTLALWLGDALEARELLEEVRTSAAARHMQSLEAEGSAALAEAELTLGRPEHAQREAEHAAHLYREMERESDADYVGRLEARAIAARLAALDPVARESAGPVLWREALRKLAKALAAADGRAIAEAEILLQEASLLRASSPKRAAERVRRAKARVRSLGPGVRDFLIGRRDEAPRALPEEPEPRTAALVSVLAARSLEHEREVAEIHGAIPSRPPLRAKLGRDPDVARLVICSSVDRGAVAVRGALPRLLPDERLVVFAKRGEEIEAWVAPGPSAHFMIGTTADWRAAMEEIARQVRDAAGWPDSVVPETLIDNSRRTLERVGANLWTPLWPALAGAARIAIVPDPALPDLPWAGLLLAAPPARWPRPRMLGLLPSVAVRRPAPWSLKPGRSLALADRSAEHSLVEREARAVARVLRGQWKTLTLGSLDALPRASLHHWAPGIVVSRQSPALSRLPDGESGAPLWRLARAGIRPELVVMPRLESEERMPLEVARIVGRVGPEGARRSGAGAGRRAKAPAFPDAAHLARTLLAAGAARAVVNAWPYEAPASAGLVGSFYAGIARGDSPAEALFTAQRRAFEEGLHPAAWAGFSIWGWP